MSAGTIDLLHILVIDDDADMRQLLTDILLPGGHQIFAVGSAEEGLEQLPYHTFQIAFLDQNLPGMEGLVFGEYLRRNNPNMKIALVTGSDDPKLERLGEENDIHVIRKPFEVSQVLDMVSAYQAEALKRKDERLSKDAPDYTLPLSEYFGELPEVFDMPSVPKRIEERLVHAIRQSLAALRSVSRYNERDRVIAYSGLVTLQVLGIKPPKGSEGRTLREDYDLLMVEHGRKTEFKED